MNEALNTHIYFTQKTHISERLPKFSCNETLNSGREEGKQETTQPTQNNVSLMKYVMAGGGWHRTNSKPSS